MKNKRNLNKSKIIITKKAFTLIKELLDQLLLNQDLVGVKKLIQI